jgi:hypothetical protein
LSVQLRLYNQRTNAKPGNFDRSRESVLPLFSPQKIISVRHAPSNSY